MTTDERIEFLIQSAESHDRQIGELTDSLVKLTVRMDKSAAKSEIDADNIRALARIAEIHHERLTHLEGGEV